MQLTRSARVFGSDERHARRLRGGQNNRPLNWYSSDVLVVVRITISRHCVVGWAVREPLPHALVFPLTVRNSEVIANPSVQESPQPHRLEQRRCGGARTTYTWFAELHRLAKR
jgi:hypothetical protein